MFAYVNCKTFGKTISTKQKHRSFFKIYIFAFSVIEFFKSVEKSIFDDIMTNHIGVSMKRFKKLEHARSLSSKLPKFPQISSEKQDENTK